MVLFPPLSWHVRARPGMGGPRPELSGSHPISTQCLPPTLEEVSAPAPRHSGLGDPSRPSVPPVVSHFLSGRRPLAGYRRVGQGSFKLTWLLSKGGSRGAQPSWAVALQPRESEHKWLKGREVASWSLVPWEWGRPASTQPPRLRAHLQGAPSLLPKTHQPLS